MGRSQRHLREREGTDSAGDTEVELEEEEE